MTTPVDERFAALVAPYLLRPGYSLERKFASDCLVRDGRIVGLVGREHLIVKVSAARATELVEGGDAERTVIGRHPAKEWVSIPPGSELWEGLLAEADAYIGSLG